MESPEMQIQAMIDFERNLVVGQEVEVRFTFGEIGRHRDIGIIQKITAASIEVKLPDQEVVVPRQFFASSGFKNYKWAVYNGVFPL